MLPPESMLCVLSYALVSCLQLPEGTSCQHKLVQLTAQLLLVLMAPMQSQVSSLVFLVSKNSRAGRVFWRGQVQQPHLKMGLCSSQRGMELPKITQRIRAESGPAPQSSDFQTHFSYTNPFCLSSIQYFVKCLDIHTVSHILLTINLCHRGFISI